MTLDTLGELLNRSPRFDHRFTIEHYCISTPAQARRLSALGGLASVNPYFVHYRSDIHNDRGFGPDRTEATARLGSLVDAGARFALHSDYNLVVAPMHPLTAVWVAVNRLGSDGESVLSPGEDLGGAGDARAITVDAAYVLGQDHRLGSIEAGKCADFAVLDEDPLKLIPGESVISMFEERSWQGRSTSRGQSKVLSEEDRLLEAKDVLMTTLGHPGQVLKSEDAQVAEVRPIPVILLCGFLGAGKTTLVCKLLEQVNDEILVIVNDIASINIDGAMVRRQDAETIELENGCACCVLGADLSDRLSEIRSRPSLPAAIVIETSGLSDPYGFSQTVRNQSGFELDGVIAVVDAKTLHERTADEFTRDLLVRQLDSAHLVIVTKSSNREEIKLISQLESLTPGRPILFDSRIKGSLQEVVFGSSLKGAHLLY